MPEARSADRGRVHRPVPVVLHEHPERRAVDLLGQDDERLGASHDLPDRAHELLDGGDRLRRHQDVGVVEHRLHPHAVADEVGRHVPVLDVQALDEVDAHAWEVVLLDAHDAVVAHAVQRLGDGAADALVLLGGDRGDVGERLEVVDGPRVAQQVGDDELDRVLDAPAQQHRVDAVGEHAHPLAQQRLGEQRGGRGPVAGEVGRLGRDLADELRAHVRELVGELDLAGDRHAVVRDRRRAGEALEDDVAALRPERDLHRVGQLVDAALQAAPCVVVEADHLAHRSDSPLRPRRRPGSRAPGGVPGRGPPWRR